MLHLDNATSVFQSTLSVRRATVVCRFWDTFYLISIHALREESDLQLLQRAELEHISIHALREESDL